MSQHEIALKMVNHGMNTGVIISTAEITLYIISSENNICNLKPWLRLSYYFKHHDGCRSWENCHFKSFCMFFLLLKSGDFNLSLRQVAALFRKKEKTKQKTQHWARHIYANINQVSPTVFSEVSLNLNADVSDPVFHCFFPKLIRCIFYQSFSLEIFTQIFNDSNSVPGRLDC